MVSVPTPLADLVRHQASSLHCRCEVVEIDLRYEDEAARENFLVNQGAAEPDAGCLSPQSRKKRDVAEVVCNSRVG